MRQDILTLFTGELRKALERLEVEDERLQEIRLRAGQPLLIRADNREWAVVKDGRLTEWTDAIIDPGRRTDRGGLPDVPINVAGERSSGASTRDRLFITKPEQIRDSFACISQYSYYAFADEISRGYVTVPGGHRVGLCGRVIQEKGECRGMRYISFLNVRVAHQIRGCGQQVIPLLYRRGRVLHTLIVSPPGGGKTTLMRDLIRLLSDGTPYGRGVNVAVVDERSELAACYQGIPQHDLGSRSDVLDGCGKSEGIMMVIRSMNPQVVAVDEIGGREDVQAVGEAARCGCAILATAHGESMKEIREKPYLGQLVRERLFERYLFLSAGKQPGTITAVLNRDGDPVESEERV